MCNASRTHPLYGAQQQRGQTPFLPVLDHPDLPLTKNEAERALRHWVIARRIGMGTRTDEGTRAFANLASVIETCRKRGLSPWPYLAEVIRQRRQGLEAPPLPLPAHL
jgi:transposase